jgi:hypothetical protein
MSDGELSRLEVLRDLDQKRLTTEAAAQLLGLERRQVFRLLKAYRAEGAAGLISKRRGRRKPEALRQAAAQGRNVTPAGVSISIRQTERPERVGTGHLPASQPHLIAL